MQTGGKAYPYILYVPEMSDTRIREMLVDLAGNKIIDCIRVTEMPLTSCVSSPRDGILQVSLDTEDTAFLYVGSAKRGATLTGPTLMLTARPDASGHLFEKLTIQLYQYQDQEQHCWFKGRIFDLYTYTKRSS